MMKQLRKFFALITLSFAVAASLHASDFSNESLNYRVMYKWGLVNKQAGHVTLSLKRNGSNYEPLLVAASEKWADRFFRVRDTLAGRIDIRSFRPAFYEKKSHEGGDHKHDIVRYSYSGNTVTGTCTRKKWDKKYRLTNDEKRTLTATGTTIDMLSSFYYMRNRPYQTWKVGHTDTVNLFSGKRKEILTIKYLGTDTVKIDKDSYVCYHISFTFTDPSNPKTKSSDDMEAWISTGADRIPIKLEGKLKVGKVQCFFNGKN